MGNRLLVLGAAGFMGSAIVEAAARAGHQVRGVLRPNGRKARYAPAASVEYVTHEYSDMRSFDGIREFDAIVDTVADRPWHQVGMLDALVGWSGRYLMLSSTAAYQTLGERVNGEDAALKPALFEDAPLTPQTYGAWKVACEHQASTMMNSAILLRPGMVVGDRSGDGIRAWVARCGRAELLAPDAPSAPVQLVDVRDLAQWTVHAVTAGFTGAFNLVPPPGTQMWGQLIEACIRAHRGDDEPVVRWVGSEELLAAGVEPMMDLAYWIPPVGESRYFYEVGCPAAEKVGWTCRELSETVTSIAATSGGMPPTQPFPRESDILSRLA